MSYELRGVTSLLVTLTIESAIEFTFDEVFKVLNTTDRQILWMDNLGSVPFNLLAERITATQIDRIQYVRIFTLDGILDQLNELTNSNSNSKLLIIIININDIFQRFKSQNHKRSHYLLDQCMRRTRELVMMEDVDAVLVDVFEDNSPSFLDYYVDKRYKISGKSIVLLK